MRRKQGNACRNMAAAVLGFATLSVGCLAAEAAPPVEQVIVGTVEVVRTERMVNGEKSRVVETVRVHVSGTDVYDVVVTMRSYNPTIARYQGQLIAFDGRRAEVAGTVATENGGKILTLTRLPRLREENPAAAIELPPGEAITAEGTLEVASGFGLMNGQPRTVTREIRIRAKDKPYPIAKENLRQYGSLLGSMLGGTVRARGILRSKNGQEALELLAAPELLAPMNPDFFMKDIAALKPGSETVRGRVELVRGEVTQLDAGKQLVMIDAVRIHAADGTAYNVANMKEGTNRMLMRFVIPLLGMDGQTVECVGKRNVAANKDAAVKSPIEFVPLEEPRLVKPQK